MVSRRPVAARTPLTFASWVSHYLPLWTAVFLVVLPNLFTNALRAKGATDSLGEFSRWSGDVILGLLSFWTWALVTNAHDGRLVHSSGKATGKLRQRQTEFAVLLFFLALTLLCYVFCRMDISVYASFPLGVLAFILAVVVLGSPRP